MVVERLSKCNKKAGLAEELSAVSRMKKIKISTKLGWCIWLSVVSSSLLSLNAAKISSNIIQVTAPEHQKSIRNQKDFFLENIEIQNSLLKLALKKKIKRTIYLGTSCIYPKFSKVPIKEESLLTGTLEKTNQCYAIAKIAGIKLCEALFEDYNLDIVCLMPTNVYGDNDNFNKVTGHVIPAIISKIEEAKKNNKEIVKLLGTGKPLREFIHTDDLADSIFRCLSVSKKVLKKKHKFKLPIINVGTNEEISIKNLSKIIAKLVKYNGKIDFDHKSPDGTFRKGLNSSKIRALGWKPKIKLADGLKKIIEKRI